MYPIYVIISLPVPVIKLSGSAVNQDDCLCLLSSHLLKNWRTTWAMRVPPALGEACRTDNLFETLDTNCGRVFMMP